MKLIKNGHNVVNSGQNREKQRADVLACFGRAAQLRERESFSLAPGSRRSLAHNSHVLRSHETNKSTCSMAIDIFILAIIRGHSWQCDMVSQSRKSSRFEV